MAPFELLLPQMLGTSYNFVGWEGDFESEIVFAEFVNKKKRGKKSCLRVREQRIVSKEK